MLECISLSEGGLWNRKELRGNEKLKLTFKLSVTQGVE